MPLLLIWTLCTQYNQLRFINRYQRNIVGTMLFDLFFQFLKDAVEVKAETCDAIIKLQYFIEKDTSGFY